MQRIQGWICSLEKLSLAMLLGMMFGLANLGCSNQSNFGLQPGSDTFASSVVYNNKVDVVFVVDNSTSMDIYQDTLATQVQSMIDKLNSLKLDYQIAVISSSVNSSQNGGKFIGSPLYLKKGGASLISQLKSRISIGGTGSNLESPFQNFQNIFFPVSSGQQSYVDTQAAGFLRSDALLSVVALSDDDDYSTITADSLYAKLQAIKPNLADGRRSWIYNYIGALTITSACRNSLGTSTVGVKHIQMADLTGGIKTSICEDTLAQAVDNIRVRIVQILSDYKLSRKPKPETISVSLNGQPVPQSTVNGWSYIAASNMVRFYGTFVPAADSVIKIDFDPDGAN